MLYRRELRGCEIRYGLSHSKTVGSLGNLASFLEKRGRAGEAEAIWQRLPDVDKDSETEDVAEDS